IRGRTHEDADGKTLCARSSAVKKVAGRVPNIMATMCQSATGNCPSFEGCPYLAQFQSKGSVFFMSHEYLFFIGPEYAFVRSRHFPSPDLVVIDESILTALVVQLPPIPAAEFIRCAGSQRDLAELIIAELREGRSPKPALRAAGWTRSKLLR